MWIRRYVSGWARVSLTLAGIAVGCGSAAPPAADLEGMWIIESITVVNNGTQETITRDATARAVRADVVVTATGDTTVVWSARLGLLISGLLSNEVTVDAQSVVIEGTKLVVTDDPSGTVTVFDYALSGDQLSLTLDAGDVRNSSADPPLSVDLARIAPWGTSSVGSWDLVSQTTNVGGTVLPDTCVEVTPGQLWVIIATTIVISDRHMFEQTSQLQAYTDSACTLPDQSATDVQGGIVEEEGATLRVWTFEPQNPDSSVYLDFTMAVSGDEITMTRNSCNPTATCIDNTPTEAVLRRRN